MKFLLASRINDNFRELLESGPKPTVAAISGLALGGGLETAMACNARLASPGGNPPPIQPFPNPHPTCCQGGHVGNLSLAKEALRGLV